MRKSMITNESRGDVVRRRPLTDIVNVSAEVVVLVENTLIGPNIISSEWIKCLAQKSARNHLNWLRPSSDVANYRRSDYTFWATL